VNSEWSIVNIAFQRTYTFTIDHSPFTIITINRQRFHEADIGIAIVVKDFMWIIWPHRETKLKNLFKIITIVSFYNKLLSTSSYLSIE